MGIIDFSNIDFEEEYENENENIDFIEKLDVDLDRISLSTIEMIEDIDEWNTGMTISPRLDNKNIELTSDYLNDNDIRLKFIEKANEISEKTFNELDDENSRTLGLGTQDSLSLSNNEINNNNGLDKLRQKIIKASNILALKGRLGPAQYILISEDLYYKIENILSIPLKPIFHDSNDIILFRKNKISEPGLIYLKNNNTNKYSLVLVGEKANKQFIKIKIRD